MDYEEIRKTVEGCTFYGIGDEAYELWSAMCGVCYLVADCYEERATILVKWIVDDALASEIWMRNEVDAGNFDSIEELGKAKGCWSYTGRPD
jgi:hypothetical protein